MIGGNKLSGHPEKERQVANSTRPKIEFVNQYESLLQSHTNAHFFILLL